MIHIATHYKSNSFEVAVELPNQSFNARQLRCLMSSTKSANYLMWSKAETGLKTNNTRTFHAVNHARKVFDWIGREAVIPG